MANNATIESLCSDIGVSRFGESEKGRRTTQGDLKRAAGQLYALNDSWQARYDLMVKDRDRWQGVAAGYQEQLQKAATKYTTLADELRQRDVAQECDRAQKLSETERHRIETAANRSSAFEVAAK